MKTKLDKPNQVVELKNKQNNFGRYHYSLPLLITAICTGVICSILVFSSTRTRITQFSSKDDDLKKSINKFELSRQEFSEELDAIIENSILALSEEKPELDKVLKNWQLQKNTIEKKINELEQRLFLVGQASDEYFAQLDQMAFGITDENLRKNELIQNDDLKKRWIELYLEAFLKIQDIRKLITNVDENLKIQRVHWYRGKMTGYNNESNEINQNLNHYQKPWRNSKSKLNNPSVQVIVAYPLICEELYFTF